MQTHRRTLVAVPDTLHAHLWTVGKSYSTMQGTGALALALLALDNEGQMTVVPWRCFDLDRPVPRT